MNTGIMCYKVLEQILMNTGIMCYKVLKQILMNTGILCSKVLKLILMDTGILCCNIRGDIISKIILRRYYKSPKINIVSPVDNIVYIFPITVL